MCKKCCYFYLKIYFTAKWICYLVSVAGDVFCEMDLWAHGGDWIQWKIVLCFTKPGTNQHQQGAPKCEIHDMRSIVNSRSNLYSKWKCFCGSVFCFKAILFDTWIHGVISTVVNVVSAWMKPILFLFDNSLIMWIHKLPLIDLKFQNLHVYVQCHNCFGIWMSRFGTKYGNESSDKWSLVCMTFRHRLVGGVAITQPCSTFNGN